MPAVRVLLALVTAFFPARMWDGFPALPVRQHAAASAILTLSLGFALGVNGFLDYSMRMMALTGRLQIEVAERQLKGELPETAEVSIGPMSVAMTAPAAFLFFTPLGWLSMYLVVSGAVRAFTCVADDAMGDPVLTMADHVAGAVTRRRRAAMAHARRERAEGKEVPDRLYPAAWAGLADAEFVLVASRRKPEWDRGTFVITPDKWYVVGEPFDRQLAEGLRTCYPLSEQKDGTVLRRAVHYSLPPLQRRVSSSISTADSSAIAPPRSS